MKKESRKTRICPQCGKIHFSTNYLCPKHSNQLQKYGKFLDNNPRTIYDPNEIRIKENYAEVDTYDKEGNIQKTFIIDIEDVPIVARYKWGTKFYKKDNLWYVARKDNSKVIYLHSFLMGFPIETIDHINGNTMDNRKCNLRIASKNIQSINQKIIANTLSGIKGVKKSRNGYVATLGWEGKSYYSKVFPLKEEASYFRYLLVHYFCPIEVRDTDESWRTTLTSAQIENINNYFTNRFKNQV